MSPPAATLVILAAGLSTRYGSLKQLAPIGPNGEALMDYNVWDAVRAGFDCVVLVIRREVESQIRAHVTRSWGERVSTDFAYQGPRSDANPKPWGTAHAVLVAAEKLTGPFAVVNADDCYGASAFRSLTAHFRTDHAAHTLVGYPIAATLSPNGGVSRAICAVTADGYLSGLTELHDVAERNHRITGTTTAGARQVLNGSETVSMNIWGFQPSVLPLLRAGFEAFRAGDLSDRAEYLLSDAVRDIVLSGQGRCRVLEARGEWCGVTFQEDTRWVQEKVRRLVAGGEYPSDVAAALRAS